MAKVLFFLIVQLLIGLCTCVNNTTFTIIAIKKCEFYIIPPMQNLTFLSCNKSDGIQQFLWENCIDACCGGIRGYDFPIPNNQNLAKCQNIFLENKDISDIIIGASVAGSFFFVGFIIIVNKIIKKMQLRVTDNNEIDEDFLQQALSLDISKIIWLKDEKIHENRLEIDCSICLQNRCNLQLSCKHLFHSECISLWLTKSLHCPNCNRINICKIKQYCINCRRQYFIMKKNVFLDDLQQFKKMKCFTCVRIQKTIQQQHLVQPWFYSFNKMEASTTFFQVRP